jgi:tetratricopeptide (TPR) repeat protein
MKQQGKTFFKHSLPRSIVALLAMSSFATSVANADELTYTMTTIVDASHGDQVAAGKYDRAIKKLSASSSKNDAFFKATNLCVAYTKVGNFADAVVACDAAVEKAKSMEYEKRSQISRRFQVKTRKTYLALALTNRGVLHAVSGDVELAQQAFSEALNTYEDATVAKTNLAKLDEVLAKQA